MFFSAIVIIPFEKLRTLQRIKGCMLRWWRQVLVF